MKYFIRNSHFDLYYLYSTTKIYVYQICYDNGSVEEFPKPLYIKTCQEPMDSSYIPYAQKISKQAKYYMIEQANYWQCLCGEINIGNICINCRVSKEEARRYTKENAPNTVGQCIQQEENERIERQKKLEEEERTELEKEEQSEEKRQRIFAFLKKYKILIGLCIVAMIVAVSIPEIIDQINMAQNKKVIDEGLSRLGEKLDDDEISNVSTYTKLFGQYGKIDYQIMAWGNKIEGMYWESFYECSNEELEEVVNQMCKYYGEHESGRYMYEDIKAYEWKDKDDVSYIYCGLSSENRIKIYWDW